MTSKKQEMNWKSRIRKLTRWRRKNGWRTTENLHGFAHGNVSEALRKHLGLNFLHGNNFFHPKQLKCIARGIRVHWNNPLLPFYRKKREEVVAQQPYFENTLEGPNSKFQKLLFASPILISSPPSFVIYRKVMEALRKPIRLDFLLFSLPSHQY